MNTWEKKSLSYINKKGFNPTLKKFLLFAEDQLPNCTITDTVRTAEEQNKYFKKGTSKLDGYIKKSNHQSGDAFDIVPYPSLWNASEREWEELNSSLIECLIKFNIAFKLDLRLEWGGNWKNFVDRPHYEIKI